MARELEMQLPVPYYSQKEEEALQKYGRKACGLTSLRMVFAYYGHPLSIQEMDQLASRIGAYREESGWIHAGLINMARDLGLKGYRINFAQLSDDDLENAGPIFAAESASLGEIESFARSFRKAQAEGGLSVVIDNVNGRIPVITSMKTSYANTIATHLVVIKGEDKGKLIINDPWDFGPDHLVGQDDFLKHWTKRAIVIYK